MSSILESSYWLARAEECEVDRLAARYRDIAAVMGGPVEPMEALPRSAVLAEAAREEDEPERSILLAAARALVAVLMRALR